MRRPAGAEATCGGEHALLRCPTSRRRHPSAGPSGTARSRRGDRCGRPAGRISGVSRRPGCDRLWRTPTGGGGTGRRPHDRLVV